LALLPRRYRWWFAPVLLTSPTILYYSRFLRDEMLFNAFLLVGIAAGSRAFTASRWAPLWATVSVTSIIFLWAIMENALFAWATILTFLAIWGLRRALWKKPAWSLRPLRPLLARRQPAPKKPVPHRLHREGSYIDRSFDQLTAPTVAETADPSFSDLNAIAPALIPTNRVQRHRRFNLALGWLAGVLLGIVLVFFIFSITTPKNYWEEWKTPIPAVAGQDSSFMSWLAKYPPLRNQIESWRYWEGQHKEHRIKGALHYHLPILMTYELPMLIVLAIGIAWDAALRRTRGLVYIGAISAWVMLWLIWRWLESRYGTMGFLQPALDFMHLTASRSSLMLGLWIIPLLVWALFALKEHRVLAAFIAYWAACSLFQYSIAGEKVPWLAVHIAIPLNLLGCWVWAPRLLRMRPEGRAVLACVALISTLLALRNDWPLIYDRAATPRERLVFNHTSVKVHKFMLAKLHIWEQEQERIPLNGRNVYLAGAPGWPGTWYFRRCAYRFALPGPNDPLEQVDLVMSEQEIAEPFVRGLDKDEWNLQQMPLRIAWLNPMPEQDLIYEYLYPDELWMPWKVWWKYWKTRKVWSNLWDYYWFRETWTQTGGYPITVIDPLRARR
jgi:uncharacterized protein (TIGR03663 family)